MLKFYGIFRGVWFVTDKEPEKGTSFITLEADDQHEAECQLFEMIAEKL